MPSGYSSGPGPSRVILELVFQPDQESHSLSWTSAAAARVICRPTAVIAQIQPARNRAYPSGPADLDLYGSANQPEAVGRATVTARQ